jgi:hypothetical protein
MNETFEQILKAVQERRPCSEATLRRYLRRLHIKPVGKLKTKPARYEPGAAQRVLGALGEKIVTLTQLRAERAKARRAAA